METIRRKAFVILILAGTLLPIGRITAVAKATLALHHASI